MTDQVEEVKSKTDIVDIIGSHIELKRAGRNFKANCPFHGEKTPSFMVSAELQMYKCFGCGEGGDVFTFLEKYDGMEFAEALKFLADKAGVKLKRIETRQKTDKERLYEVNDLVNKFYHYVLTAHSAGKVGLDYFLKERGLKSSTIETFALGFSPNIPFAGKKFLIEKHKVKKDELVRAGVVYDGPRGTFDRFRGRVIFPLYDHRGNTIGFAGRILPSEANRDLAKYINSPETPVYHKGSVLYGLNVTKSEIKRARVAIVVEGELDLISCWQAGIKNVVAIKGTAITEEQIRLLSRFTSKIILMLDHDIAGDAAARRGITIASNLGLSVKVLTLKDFKDPDEAARKDPVAFKKSFKDAVNVWDFIIESVFSKYEDKSQESMAEISREIVPVLASISDNIVQAHYVGVVAKNLGVPMDAVMRQIQATDKGNSVVEVAKQEVKTKAKTRYEMLEESLVMLSFLSSPDSLLGENRELLVSHFAKKLIDVYEEYKKTNEQFDLVKFKEFLPKELSEGFASHLLSDIGELASKPDLIEKEIVVVVRELKTINIKQRLASIGEKLKEMEDKELEIPESLQEEFKIYSKELAELRQKP